MSVAEVVGSARRADRRLDGRVPVATAEAVVVERTSLGVGEHQIRPGRVLGEMDRQFFAQEGGDADRAVGLL